MKDRHARRLRFVLAVAIFLSGCAGPGLLDSGEADLDDADDKNGFEARVLDRLCPLELKGAAPVAGEHDLRVLRGQLFLGVVARYGAGRFESYSNDVPGDAAKLLSRIEVAGRRLQSYRDADGNYLAPTLRIDAIVAIAEAAEVALRPTVRGIVTLVVPTSPLDRARKAREILGNLVEDKLYQKAYFQSCSGLRADLGLAGGGALNAAKLAQARKDTDAHLATHCERLSKLADATRHSCIALWPAAAGGAGGAPAPAH